MSNQQKDVRGSTPANIPVKFLYYAGGLYHYAGSCCVAPNPHSAIILSNEPVPETSCGGMGVPGQSINQPVTTIQHLIDNTNFRTAARSIPAELITYYQETSSLPDVETWEVDHVVVEEFVRFIPHEDAGDDLTRFVQRKLQRYRSYQIERITTSLEVEIPDGGGTQTIEFNYFQCFPTMHNPKVEYEVTDFSYSERSNINAGWVTTTVDSETSNCIVRW